MKLNHLMKFIAGVCIGSASMLSPTPAISETSEPHSKKRTFSDSGVIGAEDWKCQGKFLALDCMDEHLHRYGMLDDFVNQESKDGRFWKSINYHVEPKGEQTYIVLNGTRSDGMKFSVSTEVLENTYLFIRKAFDNLCEELSGKLTEEDNKCLAQ